MKYSESGYLTVGEIKKFLNEHQLPDDAVVVVQRVEDIYYKEHNWGSYLKKGEFKYNCPQHSGKEFKSFFVEEDIGKDELFKKLKNIYKGDSDIDILPK